MLLLGYLDSSLVSSWLAAFGARSSAVVRCWLAGGAPRLICITSPLKHSGTARCAVQCRERNGAEHESSGTWGIPPDHDLCGRPRRPFADDCDRLGQSRVSGCLHGGRSRIGSSSRGGRRGMSWYHFRGTGGHSCGRRGVMGRGGRRQSHGGLSELLGAGYGLARRRPIAPRRLHRPEHLEERWC